MSTSPYTRALVTGASSGIGAAFAHLLAERGVELVVVARSTDKLEKLAEELPVQVEVLTADLTSQADLDRVAARVEADPAIDLVINNAGFGESRDIVEADLDRELAQVDIHIRAVMTLSSAAARTMRPRGAGGILNVSSMAGFQPLPGSATYAACKAFETSWTQSLHLELAKDGVHVTALCPGFVDTPMIAGDDQLSKLPSLVVLSADGVAASGLRGVERNDPIVVPGIAWKAAASVSQVMPGPAMRLLMRGARKLR